MAAPQGIIRRKLAASRAEAEGGVPGADRGWRIALARAARDRLKLVLEVRGLTLDRRSLGEVIELVPEHALVAVLEGPGESLGAIVLSPQVLTGFIEAQTTGRLKATEVGARKPTRTDAAMVVAVIDAALAGLEQLLAEEADLVWAGGFRYASFLDDPRPLGLLLDDDCFRVLRAGVALGGGLRSGEIMLALPAEGRGLGPAGKPDAHGTPDHGHVFAQALAERVQGANCRIEAVLARLTMPLADVMRLGAGALLPLPQAALDRISLEGLDGRRLAEGRLGQNRGMRAIRLKEGAEAARASEPEPAPEPLPMMGMADLGAADLGDIMFQATGTE